MDDQIYRIKVKLGQAEFDAEGPEAAVKEAYKEFLLALRPGVQSDSLSPLRGNSVGAADNNSSIDPGNDGEAPLDSAEETQSKRLFMIHKDNTVSLRLLPKGKERDGDALLLLLYGYLLFRKLEHVTALELMKATKQSGIQLDRLDRTFARYSPYVNTGGARKGKRYSLNNQGITKARELAKETLG